MEPSHKLHSPSLRELGFGKKPKAKLFMQDTPIQIVRSPRKGSVAIIVNIDDHTTLPFDTLQSCLQQTVRPAEMLLLGDIKEADVEQFATSLPGVVVQQKNKEFSADRIAALGSLFSEFVIIVNSGERLTSRAIEEGLACFAKYPNAWLVCGAHRVFDAAGRPSSAIWRERVDRQLSGDLLRQGDLIAVQAAAVYRTDCLRALLGEVNRKLGESQNVCLDGPTIATHDACVAEYRYNKGLMLTRSGVGFRAERLGDANIAAPAERGLLFHHNAPELFAAAARELITDGWNYRFGKDDVSHGENGAHPPAAKNLVAWHNSAYKSVTAPDWQGFRRKAVGSSGRRHTLRRLW